jgi:hypothetical protein
MEQVIIGIIILGALALTLYKIFVKPSCSCGCGGKKSKCKAGEHSLADGLSDD